MIRLFDRTETNFNHNKTILTPLSCYVEEEANGLFELVAEFPKNIIIDNGGIIKAPTPRGEQLFRVYKSFKTLRTRQVYARHIFYDLSSNFIINVNLSNTSCFTALQEVLSNAEVQHNFIGTSDINELHDVVFERVNPIQAIIGDDNSILNTFGGNLIRDNYNMQIKANGLDRGYDIRMSKNLIGIECEMDESSVKTRIFPTVTLSIDSVDTTYTLPEKYVDSPLINNYGKPIIYTEEIALTDEQKALPLTEIYNIMRDYCNKLFGESNMDKPVVNYKVDFVELSKTEQYKGLAILEQLDLYDIVTCNVADLDINVKAKVIKYKYDCLKEKYDTIELGNFKNVSSYKTENIIKKINERMTANESAIDYATNIITGNKGGYLVFRKYPDGKPYELLVMDTEDINTATNVFRLNNSGLGFSRNGYNGQFGTAITIDGHIVADYIDTGVLRSILLESNNYVANTSGMRINLSDGSINSKNFKVTTLGDATFNGAITGGTLNINNRFRVDASGNMIATNANLSGNISGSTITGSDITGSTLSSVGVDSNVIIEEGHVFCGDLFSMYGSMDKHVVALGDISVSRYTTLSAGRMTLTGSGAYLQINGSPVITVSDRNSYTYPPASHSHSVLQDGSYQLNWAGASCLFAWSGQDLGQSPYRWGGIYLSSSPNVSSDRNLKNSIEELPEVYKQLILQCKPVRFKYNDGKSDRYHAGFISQDVETVMDEIDMDSKDFAGFIKSPIYAVMDESGAYDTTSEITGYIYMLRYEEFIAPAISVIQEQSDKIDTLERKLEALEQRLSKLEVA